MQQEDEYRIQMELNRYYLRKDSLSVGVSSEQSLYETETAHTPSSRGKQHQQLTQSSAAAETELWLLGKGLSSERTKDSLV